MADIHLLKKDVFELIAAGEVVAAPFCVVKELIENSIDAESSYIFVEIKNMELELKTINVNWLF